ncbi:hypothetical protein ACF0H5_016793 [Mactra antiquata]
MKGKSPEPVCSHRDPIEENVDQVNIVLPNISTTALNETLTTIMSDDTRDADWSPDISLIEGKNQRKPRKSISTRRGNLLFMKVALMAYLRHAICVGRHVI